MADTLGYQFDRVYNAPIETYRKVLTTAERDLIPAGKRWEGMICYVSTPTSKEYRLVGGIDNIHWVELGEYVANYFTNNSDIFGNIFRNFVENNAAFFGDTLISFFENNPTTLGDILNNYYTSNPVDFCALIGNCGDVTPPTNVLPTITSVNITSPNNCCEDII